MTIREQLEIKYSSKYFYDFSKVSTTSLNMRISYTCLDHDREVTATAKDALENYVVCEKCVKEYAVSEQNYVASLLKSYPNTVIYYDTKLCLKVECKECGNALKMKDSYTIPKCRTCSKPGYVEKEKQAFESLRENQGLRPTKVLLGARKVKYTCQVHGDSICTLKHWDTAAIVCSKCFSSVKTGPLSYYVEKYKDTLWTPLRIEGPLLVLSCPNHGEIALAPYAQGIPCRKCKKNVQRITTNFKTWEQKARAVHGNRFDYSFGDYLGGKNSIRIQCIEHNRLFWYNASNHILTASGGCPDCQYGTCGFNQQKPAILYYLRLKYGAYKIGITNSTVEKRYTVTEAKEFDIVKTWEYTTGADALAEEQRILSQFKANRYTGNPILTSVGITEMFNKDVLNLDQKKKDRK